MLKFNSKTASYEYVTDEYPGHCIRCIDGDTAIVMVDMGLRGYREESFRVKGINAPELHAPTPDVRKQALASKAELEKLLSPSPSVGTWGLRMVVYQDQSFARWVADIFVMSPTGELNVGQEMIRRGFAVVDIVP